MFYGWTLKKGVMRPINGGKSLHSLDALLTEARKLQVNFIVFLHYRTMTTVATYSPSPRSGRP